MTRETKVGLLVGLGMILLIGIIVSDHLSVVSQQEAATLTHFADSAQRSLSSGAATMPPAARQELTYQPPAQTQQPVPMAEELRQPPREAVNTDLTQDQPRREPQRAYALVEREQNQGSVQDLVTRDVTTPSVTQDPPQPQLQQQPVADNRMAALQQQGEFVAVRHELDRSTYQMGSDTLRFRETSAPIVERDQPQQPIATPQTIPVTTAQPTVIVKSGETLTAIARQNLGDGNRWKEIFELNRDKLDTPESLKAGMRINLPRSNAPVAQAPIAPVQPQPAAAQSPQPPRLQDLRTARRTETPERTTAPAPNKTYVVQQGDSLYKIAQKTMGDGSQWKKLYTANKARIGDPDAVKVGTELMIPQS